MALRFSLLCSLCVATLLDVRVDLDLRLATGCSIGVDLPQIPVSASLPPENVTRFALSTCENRLDLGWVLYPNDTIVFQLTRNGSFTAQCVSDKVTLAPCTIYSQPDIGQFFKVKPTGIFPDCTAPNTILSAAPMSVTTAPTLDVLISGGVATGAGYCTGTSYLYYMPPKELNTTTIPSSVGAPCDIIIYNYTVESNGNITHYARSRANPPQWFVNCTTSPTNTTCSGSYNSGNSIIYLYSFGVLRYGPIAQSIATGVCGLSQAPTSPTASLAPTASSAPTSSAPTAPTSLAPTANATTASASSLLPGLLLSLLPLPLLLF